MGYILCEKDNGIILKNITIKDIGDSINLLNESITFNNQHTYPPNIYLTCDLVFFVISIGQDHSSPH